MESVSFGSGEGTAMKGRLDGGEARLLIG